MKNPRSSKIFILLTIVSIVGVIALYSVLFYLKPRLSISNHIFTYESAITPAKQMQGLSGRSVLPMNHGMLFIYNRKEQFPYWMKDMKFSIDIIWIDDTTVVDITKNIPYPNSETQLQVYTPKQPVNRVFEVNGGTVDQLGIKIGDKVTYLKR